MLKSVFIVDLTRIFYLAFGDNYVNTNEDTRTPILSATKIKCLPRTLSFWRHEAYADIRC